ncbi:MAG: alpha/beta fold hydrolase [Sporichthyaceae bacterium]
MNDADIVHAQGPWTHRQIAANGARFHVAEAGAGPLVLLLHGYPTFWWTWRHQLTALAGAGYRAVAMDLRGYGGSDKTPRGYDPFTLTNDVAGVIRSLGAPRAALVGHGWGALIGWAAGVFHADLVSGLVAVAAAHPRQMRAALTGGRRQLAASSYVLGYQRPWIPERQLTRENSGAVEELLRAWSAPGAWPDADSVHRYRAAMQIESVAHCALEYHRWAVRSLARPDGLRFARRMREPLRCPVLQIHGALDPVVLPETVAGSQRYVQGPYRAVTLPGVGHFPQEEDPGALREVLLDWLSEHEPVPR